uniref:Rho-GAP domain-containing protein n=1 Tax=Panagrellus redivivus TaxID=6233 RepID=A0A7E4V8Z3_PANRE
MSSFCHSCQTGSEISLLTFSIDDNLYDVSPSDIKSAYLQYFLASLCDWQVKDEKKMRLGLRYSKTPEVQKLISKLHKSKFVGREIKNADPNAIVCVLKEVLTEFPGGIFADCNEEFLCVSLKSPQEIALIYANGLIENLPIFLRQFTYLVCKCLRNLARQSSGSLIDSYTDLLLLFTPVLFPNSVGDVSRFLRATRITLILVDLCDTVFRPFLTLNLESNSDSAYHSDEDFFKDIVNSLNSLQDEFDTDETASSVDSALSPDNGSEFSDDGTKPHEPESNNLYYQITYVDS